MFSPDSERNFNGSADPMITADHGFMQILGPDFDLFVRKFGSWVSTFPRKSHFLSFMCRMSRSGEND